MVERAIIFDSGTLISFSMNGLLGEVEKLKEIFNGKFLITKDVKREVIDKPLTIKRFMLEGLRLKRLFDLKILEMPESVGVGEDELSKKTLELRNIANNTYIGRGKEIHIIDSGEASCLALSKILTEKKIENVIAVDERTTRMLGEKPENVQKLLQKKLHTSITYEEKNFDYFKGFKFIRSAELVYVMHKKGIMVLDGAETLDALLWSVKFKGCAISGDEISEIKKIG